MWIFSDLSTQCAYAISDSIIGQHLFGWHHVNSCHFSLILAFCCLTKSSELNMRPMESITEYTVNVKPFVASTSYRDYYRNDRKQQNLHSKYCDESRHYLSLFIDRPADVVDGETLRKSCLGFGIFFGAEPCQCGYQLKRGRWIKMTKIILGGSQQYKVYFMRKQVIILSIWYEAIFTCLFTIFFFTMGTNRIPGKFALISGIGSDFHVFGAQTKWRLFSL